MFAVVYSYQRDLNRYVRLEIQGFKTMRKHFCMHWILGVHLNSDGIVFFIVVSHGCLPIFSKFVQTVFFQCNLFLIYQPALNTAM